MRVLVLIELMVLLYPNIIMGQDSRTIELTHKAIEKREIREIALKENDFGFLFLEQPKEALIQQTSACKIIRTKKKIYIFDFLSSKVHSYDSSGKYLYTINRKGKGPFEYKIMRNVMMVYDENLCFWDSMNNKLIFFDGNGKPLNEIRLEIRLDNVIYSDPWFYALGLVDQDYCLIRMDHSGVIKNHWIIAEGANKEICLKYNSETSLFIDEGNVCFATEPYDKIQVLNNNKIEDYWVIKYGKDRVSNESLLKNDPYLKYQTLGQEGKVGLHSIQSFGNYFFILLTDGPKTIDVFYDKAKNQLIQPDYSLSLNNNQFKILDFCQYVDQNCAVLVEGSDLEEAFQTTNIRSKVLNDMLALANNRIGVF